MPSEARRGLMIAQRAIVARDPCVLWSKAAKALSTAPSKGVTFDGLVSLVESGQGPFDDAVKRRDF
jgi:hypothetical protein